LIIIDDIGAVCRLLPPKLRDAISPDVEKLRQEITGFARRKRYQILLHDDFSDWALTKIDTNDTIVSLDPLIGPAVDERIQRIGVHRYWSKTALEVRCTSDVDLHTLSGSILIDDAVYTGSTLKAIFDAGLAPKGVLTGTAKPSALDTLGSIAISAHTQCLSGDILHLRDFCPLLPFSGRSLLGRGPGYRVSPLLNNGGAGLHLQGETELRLVLLRQSGRILGAIDRLFGRLIEPGDLNKICPEIAQPLPNQDTEMDSQSVFDSLRIAAI